MDDKENQVNPNEKTDDTEDFITEMFGGALDVPCNSNSTLQQQVKVVELEQRQPTTYDVWQHWVNRRTTHPELYAVATMVMSVPPTQASVERAFSALALVLSPHRSTMGEDTLENILLVKLNEELYLQIISNLYDWNDALPEQGVPDA